MVSVAHELTVDVFVAIAQTVIPQGQASTAETVPPARSAVESRDRSPTETSRHLAWKHSPTYPHIGIL